MGGSETEEEQRKRLERADWKRRAFWNLKRPEPPQPLEVVEEKHEDEYAGQSFLSRQLNLWLSGNDCQDAVVEPDTDHEQGTGSRHSGSRKSSPVRFQKRSTSSVGSNDEGDQPRVRDATRRKSKMADMVIQVDKNGEKVRLQDMVEVWLNTLRRSQGGPSVEEREEREEEARRQREQQNERHDSVVRAVRRKMTHFSYSSTASSPEVSRKEKVRTHWKNLAHDAARAEKDKEPRDSYNEPPGTRKSVEQRDSPTRHQYIFCKYQ